MIQTGNNVTAKSLPWNGAISPNGSVTFGFQGTFSGTNDIPVITVE